MKDSENIEDLILGDCRIEMGRFPDNHFDAVVCDPPYELKFMGRKWDGTGIAYDVEMWGEVLRVLKPGGFLLAFGGSRTYHRMACAIEDAGFGVHPMIAWVNGQGFPKATDLSKQLDRRRHDDTRPVCRFLREIIEASRQTVKSIAMHFGFHPRMIEHWAARDTDSQPSCPTWPQWLELKVLLRFGSEMDAEVWRLNGRKGKPGEAWAEREVVGVQRGAMRGWDVDGGTEFIDRDITLPSTPEAIKWDGWKYGKQALKPAVEPVCMAQKPYDGKAVDSILKWGVGALNVDGSRIATGEKLAQGSHRPGMNFDDDAYEWPGKGPGQHPRGRFPANLILGHHAECDGTCHPDCPVRMLDEQSVAGGIHGAGKARKGSNTPRPQEYHGEVRIAPARNTGDMHRLGDTGGASRFFKRVNWNGDARSFFYCPKASRKERNAGCEGMAARERAGINKMMGSDEGGVSMKTGSGNIRNNRLQNNHPTVKPLKLMRYLCRLVTPPNGLILDPFAGSGTTGMAAILEGFRAVLIEQDAGYVEIAKARCEWAAGERTPGEGTQLQLLDIV